MPIPRRSLLLAGAAAGLLTACGGGDDDHAPPNIVATAQATPNLSILVEAVVAAGLVDALSAPGPLTVFAPTNAAFAALPAGTVDTLLKPENKAALTGVLTYHVVPGNVDAKSLLAKIKAGKGSATLTTVQGDALVARTADGGVTITDAKGNTAKVSIADVRQKNGVIHVVDRVLLP